MKTKEQLEEAAKKCCNFSEMLRYFGMRIAGGSHAQLKKRCKQLGIDTSHFKGNRSHAGKISNQRIPFTKILIKMPKGSDRRHIEQLRRAMIEYGIDYQCACGIKTEWVGLPIVLEVDHIDGDPANNLPDNVRFICPNCHSQTNTYKNRRRSS